MVRFLFLIPLVIPLVLAACVQNGPAMRFFEGEVVVAPPSGYCVNQKASTMRKDRALALLGKCRFSGQAEAALIAVTLGESGSGLSLASGTQAMASHLNSPQGRASLARDGRVASVKLEQMALGADYLIFHVQDRSSGPHWRAITSLKGRLTSISVQDPEGASLAQGRAVLEETLQALRRANTR